jgi:hypothetical protein
MVMPDVAERDIELVLITGAGASRSLAASRTPGVDQVFPLMADWSSALIEKMSNAPSQNVMTMRQMLPLTEQMDGPSFERALGTFIRQAQAFDVIEPLLKPSTALINIQQSLKGQLQSGQSILEDWHHWTQSAIRELLDLLNETLFEQFHLGIDEQAAAGAYGWLLQQLQIAPGSSFVYATTNYDIVGETALGCLNYLVDWGRPPQLTNPSPDTPLSVERLLHSLPRYVPVLHLHGRIGWYLRQDGSIRDYIVSNHNKEWGTPVVMWPDDQKDATAYAATRVVDDIWGQFREALGRARRVLVLGHSLHDPFLTQAIREHVPPTRLAVTTLGDENGANQQEIARMRAEVGDATFVLLDFNATRSAGDELAKWAVRVNQLP